RSKDRGESAVELIKEETKNDAVEFLQLDLQSLNSVKVAAETFLARKLPLHILVNNAGIMATPFATTVDGIQDQFGTNHIGHFVFTLLLLPTIKASAPSRIINVSSEAYRLAPSPAGIEFEKLNDPKAHTAFQRYNQSKLANILFTLELNKRLSGTNVYCNCLHPGVIKTELMRGVVADWGSWVKPILSVITFFFLTPDDGALTQLYCATSPEIEEKNLRGKYFVPFGKVGEPSAKGKDEELAKKLWDFSENFVKEKLGANIFMTGGNTGIGIITVRELARKNAHVFVASRSKDRGESAVELIKEETKNDAVEFLQLDLQSLNSVKIAAETFLARNLPLHILVNNAGISATPFATTVDGIQDQFGTNHIGHFVTSAPSRIVNVSGGLHKLISSPAGIEFEKLNDPEAQTPFQRYSQSKLANILFTLELNKRLSGTNVYCNSLHPGVIKTELSRGVVADWGFWIKPIIYIFSLFLLSPDDGALTQLYCATSPEIEEKNLRGLYFEPFGEVGEPATQAKDEELAKKLWDFSENFVKEKLGDDIFSKCYA
ncbi:25362_t:CDS:10, partial [Dentiscutata erythropus]